MRLAPWVRSLARKLARTFADSSSSLRLRRLASELCPAKPSSELRLGAAISRVGGPAPRDRDRDRSAAPGILRSVGAAASRTDSLSHELCDQLVQGDVGAELRREPGEPVCPLARAALAPELHRQRRDCGKFYPRRDSRPGPRSRAARGCMSWFLLSRT
jgi:hypothetical protein